MFARTIFRYFIYDKGLINKQTLSNLQYLAASVQWVVYVNFFPENSCRLQFEQTN